MSLTIILAAVLVPISDWLLVDATPTFLYLGFAVLFVLNFVLLVIWSKTRVVTISINQMCTELYGTWTFFKTLFQCLFPCCYRHRTDGH